MIPLSIRRTVVRSESHRDSCGGEPRARSARLSERSTRRETRAATPVACQRKRKPMAAVLVIVAALAVAANRTDPPGTRRSLGSQHSQEPHRPRVTTHRHRVVSARPDRTLDPILERRRRASTCGLRLRGGGRPDRRPLPYHPSAGPRTLNYLSGEVLSGNGTKGSGTMVALTGRSPTRRAATTGSRTETRARDARLRALASHQWRLRGAQKPSR
jgi:hypothetical protein